MSLIQAFILGVLQGLTEFLPVSSSGHLVFVEHFLDIPIAVQSLQGFDIVLHAGTLAALVLVYARTWINIASSVLEGDTQHRRLLITLIIASLPAAIVGFLYQDFIIFMFRSPASVGIMLLLTACVLVAGSQSPVTFKQPSPSRMRAFWIGCAQALALIPGLSRSGLTISVGRMVGLSRSTALDFSFLMAVPVMTGALLMAFIRSANGMVLLPSVQILLVGFLSSFAVSIFAIIFLRRFIMRHHLGWFAVYLVPVGLLLLVFAR